MTTFYCFEIEIYKFNLFDQQNYSILIRLINGPRLDILPRCDHKSDHFNCDDIQFLRQTKNTLL